MPCRVTANSYIMCRQRSFAVRQGGDCFKALGLHVCFADFCTGVGECVSANASLHRDAWESATSCLLLAEPLPAEGPGFSDEESFHLFPGQLDQQLRRWVRLGRVEEHQAFQGHQLEIARVGVFLLTESQ